MNSKINIRNLVRKNILNLKPYSSARDEFSGTDAVFLDANENPFGSYNRYPDPYQNKLKDRISEIKNIPQEKIFFGNGSDEVIDILMRIFCEPERDKILIFPPTYGMYEVSAQINNVKINEIYLDGNFQISCNEELKEKLSDPHLKIVFICSPNNPTGNLIRRESVDFILENFAGIVVIDEAYIDFAEEGSWISKLNEFPNLVILQTFSKYWGMAGLRIGMCFADPEILTLMYKVKPPYNISLINQETVLKNLADIGRFRLQLKAILSEKQKLTQELERLDFVRKIYPSDSNFLLVETENAGKIYDFLVNEKIIVRNRHSVVENCLRISIGTPPENQKLINILNKYKP